MRGVVLGAGSIGRRHLRNLKTLGHSDVTVFDPNPAARASTAAEEHVDTVADLGEVWASKPEFAIVASPPETHVQLARHAVEHGCHVLVEKPLALSLAGIDELQRAVDRNGRVAMVACNMRFHPGPALVKRLLSERAIGAALAARLHTGSFLPRWRPSQDFRQSYSVAPECGAILDCIHEIDLALWYFGPAKLIGAAVMPATTLDIAADGLAELLLVHTSGTLASVHLNFVQRDYRRSCQIIGAEGSVYWDFEQNEVIVYNRDGEIDKRYRQPTTWQINDMYVDELSHFFKCITTGDTPMNTLAGGRAALEIALAAKESALKSRN